MNKENLKLKTKLCTEGVIETSLEEREMSDREFNPVSKLFIV